MERVPLFPLSIVSRGIRMEFPDELFRVGEISVGNGTVDFPYC